MASHILTETIHYSPSGAKDALDKIRQFAISLGWTVDYWSTIDGGGSDYYLQLWAPGYVNQNMCYRFYVTNVDAQEDTMTVVAVIPGQRHDQSSKMTNSGTIWGGAGTTYRNISLPASSFTALYLYGNDRFISALYNINPTSVITVPFGTFELLPSWWEYVDGLFFWYGSQIWSSGSTYKWYNMTDNPTNWYIPYGRRDSGGTGYNVYWEGAKRDSNHYACNYRPDSTDSVGGENGEFNSAKGILNWNAFTSRRTAFHSTVFCKEPTLGVWYPIGNHFHAWVNGRDLTIGEKIYFGSDEYKVFPGVFTGYDIWQGYRIA